MSGRAMAAPNARYGTAVRWILGALLVAGLLVMWRTLPVERALAALGAFGPFAFGALYVTAALLLMPGSPMTAAAGALFGAGRGFATALAAATLAAALAFLMARYVARERVERASAGRPKFAALDRAIAAGGWKVVLLMRLSPAIPYNLINYAFGLTAVRFGHYLLASCVGMIPGTVFWVWVGAVGAEVARDGEALTAGEWALWTVGLAATAALSVYLTVLARRQLGDRRENDAQESEGERPGEVPVARDAAPELAPLEPLGPSNRALAANVRPAAWPSPEPRGRYNLVVIGGGTAGLVSALGAAGLGARVALVEDELLGGDCLNVGCVPSKALLRAAQAAVDARGSGALGVEAGGEVAVDFPAVMERMRAIRARLSEHDSARRLSESGVDVYFARARFVSRDAVEVGGRTLRFARACIATGSRPLEPDVPGLREAGYLTNVTLFSLTELPQRLAVVGGGPIGCEMAQAFARFGARVTLVESGARILGRDDPEASALVRAALERDGARVLTETKLSRVERSDGGKRLDLRTSGGSETLLVDELIVGVGRAPNVERLGLERAGVAFDARRGVHVDDRLRSTNERVFAAGDVCTPYRFTHVADAHARIVVRNALFLGRARASALTIPWCTYTDPEVAHVGLDERQARESGLDVLTLRVDLADVDRAVLDGAEQGFLRVVAKRGSGEVVGATLVARGAGDMLAHATLAIQRGATLQDLSNVIHPYPTRSEVFRKAGDAWMRAKVTPGVRRWLGWFLGLRR